MSRKRRGMLAAVIQFVIVACVSLAIVGGAVAWMASREGTGLGDLMSGLRSGRQAARPALPGITPFPTYTPQPSPTPAPIGVAPTEEPTDEAMPVPRPGDVPPTSMLPTTMPGAPAGPTPNSPTEPQIEAAIESPIRQGSPLPERPATRLVIPAMGLDIPVIISPIENQTWQVEHLGKDFVGHLEGTSSPGDPSNVVLAGHVTIAHNVYGPFAGLGELEPGDPITVYAGDRSYTYIVDYRQLVDRTDVQVAYPTDTGRVTLITCSNWSDELGTYQERLIVVGHLENGGS
jgi:LPXTG-site transpeptidase (sortase) family protein